MRFKWCIARFPNLIISWVRVDSVKVRIIYYYYYYYLSNIESLKKYGCHAPLAISSPLTSRLAPLVFKWACNGVRHSCLAAVPLASTAVTYASSEMLPAPSPIELASSCTSISCRLASFASSLQISINSWSLAKLLSVTFLTLNISGKRSENIYGKVRRGWNLCGNVFFGGVSIIDHRVSLLKWPIHE